jgi:hypothetical protein
MIDQRNPTRDQLFEAETKLDAEILLLSQLCHSFVTTPVIPIGYNDPAADENDRHGRLRSRGTQHLGLDNLSVTMGLI